MEHVLAIVGFGGMAGWHYDLIERIEGLTVSGIWDIKEERRTYARSRKIHVYESLEDLLADESVDLVLVAAPNDVHKGIAIQAMEAGKNVVSEKPVTLSSRDLEEMILASDRTGRFLTVHQNRRWDEDFLTVKKVLEEARLGEIFRLESRVHGSRGIPGDWRQEKEHGGGMVLDWGRDIRIVRALGMDEKDVVPVRTAAGLTKTMAPRREDSIRVEEEPEVASDVRDFYRNVMAVLEGREESRIKLEEVARVMLLMEAIFRSAEEKQAVRFEE